MTFEDFIKIMICAAISFLVGVLINPILGLVLAWVLGREVI